MIKTVKKVMQFVEWLLILLLFVSVVIVVMQIIWRKVLRDPLSWTDQTARFLFVWMTMLGIPVLFNKNILMSFDLVQEKLKDRSRDIFRIVFRILGLFFSVAYFLFSMQLCMKSVGNYFAGIRIPYNWLYSSQPVCCVLLFFVLLAQTIEILQQLQKPKSTDKEGEQAC